MNSRMFATSGPQTIKLAPPRRVLRWMRAETSLIVSTSVSYHSETVPVKSGGAVALASTNKVLILENSIYSVISPEGCASILWKDPSKSQLAAKVMKISATDLLKHKIVDEIVPEPLGGAHRDKDEAINFLRIALRKNIESLATMSKSEILSQRKNRFLSIGRENKFTSLIGDQSENKILNQFKDLRNKKLFLPALFGVVVLLFLFFYFFIN